MKLSISRKVLGTLEKLKRRSGLCLVLGRCDRYGFRAAIPKALRDMVVAAVEGMESREEGNENDGMLCNIGFVELVGIACYSGPSELGKCKVYSTGKNFEVLVGGSTVGVRILGSVQSVKELFDGIKWILSKLEVTRVAYKGKIRLPLYPTRGSVNMPSVEENIAIPYPQGAEAAVCLLNHEGISILVGGSALVRLRERPVEGVDDTVLVGYWYEGSFYGYDVIRICSEDFSKRRYRVRLVLALGIIKRTDGVLCCPLVDTRSRLLIPDKANLYTQQKSIYLPLAELRFYFHVEATSSTLKLTLAPGREPFLGSKDYPFKSVIPLAREDSSVLQGDGIYEFKWWGNSFVPIGRVSRMFPMTQEEAQLAWKVLNGGGGEVVAA